MPNPSSKRKADEIADADAPEPKTKLTKKERMAAARANIQQFAERDKAKVEAAKAKKLNLQQSDDDDAVIAEPKKKKKKIEPSSSKEQKKMEMKESAKKFAARDKANLMAAAKAASPVPKAPPAASAQILPPAPPVAAAKAASPVPKAPPAASAQILPPAPPVAAAKAASPVPKAPPAALAQISPPAPPVAAKNLGGIDPVLLAKYGQQQEQLRLQQQEQLRLDQQSRLQEQYGQQQNTSRLCNLLSPAAEQNVAVHATAGLATSVTTTMPVSSQPMDDDDDDDDYVPPPPALMQQISQQVLLNERDLPADNDDDDIFLQDDDVQEGSLVADTHAEIQDPPIELQEQTARWFSCGQVFFLILIISIISVVANIPDSPTPSFKEVEETSSNEVVVNDSQCFLDSEVPDIDPESEDEYIASCSESNNGVTCPSGGVCEGGKLVDCRNMFQDVSKKGDRCILSEKYLSMGMTITNELVSHASRKCNKYPEPIKYDMLKDKHPDILVDGSQEFIDALEGHGYQIDKKKDGLYLDLPENFNLNLPGYCQLGDAGHWLLEKVGLFLWNITSIVLTTFWYNFWGLVTNYPMLAGPGLCVFVCVLMYCKRRAKKEQREIDTVKLRNMTYDTLKAGSNTSHIVLHIRDEIAHTIHPISRKQRQILITEIWPKVVYVVKYDTRVRKTKRVVDGNTRDVWQWVAAETPIKG
jgi:hypothetical protein